MLEFLKGTLMDSSIDPRPSPIAGTWYPGRKDSLSQAISAYLAKASKPEISGEVLGMIVPHAGYVYSGQTAATAFKAIEGSSPQLVILLSPLHAAMRDGIFTTGHSAYRTPLGDVPVSRAAQEKLAQECDTQGIPLFEIRNDQEHSLEIELPFLQTILAHPFEILPVMVRDRSPARLKLLGESLAEITREQPCVLVASTDLSHFYPLRVAQQLDRHMLAEMESLSPEGVLQAEQEGAGFACGAGGVAAFLWAVKALGANRAVLTHYSTSAEQTGDASSVVGYGALVVTRD